MVHVREQAGRGGMFNTISLTDFFLGRALFMYLPK
jgi:hypothetical protein